MVVMMVTITMMIIITVLLIMMAMITRIMLIVILMVIILVLIHFHLSVESNPSGTAFGWSRKLMLPSQRVL